MEEGWHDECSAKRASMRTPYDQFVKQFLRAALRPVGVVETEQEVSADAQRIDVCFVPDPARAHGRRALGLLGRMAEGTCLFEAFHEAPSVRDLRDCLRKLLTWDHAARRPPPTAPLPSLWILAAGRPALGLAEFGFAPMTDWSQGMYEAVAGLGLRLVVLSELPRNEDTLPLRLMGAGRVLAGAIRDIYALPVEVPLRSLALPIVVSLRMAITEHPVNTENEDLMEATQDLFEEFQQRLLRQGREEGIQEGWLKARQLGLDHLAQCRLGRPLSDHEADAISERVQRLGAERIEEVVLGGTASEVAAWLADPRGT